MPGLGDGPDAGVLGAHLAHLRLRGRAERTVAERRYAVLRLAAWLEARYADQETGSTPLAPTGGGGVRVLSPELRLSGDGVTRYGRPHAAAGDLLLCATSADLAAWRASLTVSDRTVVAYVIRVREFYRWAVHEGLMESINPAEGLPLPRVPHALPRPIAEDDLTRALEHASARVRPWLVLAGWAGSPRRG